MCPDQDTSLLLRPTLCFVQRTSALYIEFGDVLVPGTEYFIDFYLDLDSDGACDLPPADHVWHTAIGAVTGDVNFMFQHDALPFDTMGCQPFP